MRIPFFRSCRCLLPLACLGLLPSTCPAQSLIDSLDRALASEPTYLGSKAEYDAWDARERQAVGALLPQVSGSGSITRNARESKSPATFFSTGETEEYYDIRSAQINLKLPLLNYPAIFARHQSQSSLAQAEYKLQATGFDLSAKVVSAWLDMLAGRDSFEFNRKQVAATRRQWELVRRGVELGTHSLPQQEEARVKYDQAIAEQLLSENEQELKRAQLEQLVGASRDDNWPLLREDAVLVDLVIDDIDRWLNVLETQSPTLLAAKRAQQAAESEVSKQLAGHMPSLDVLGSYGINRQGSGSSPGQSGFDSKQASIGLQLNVPLYSGGSQHAKVAEAVALRTKARLEVEAARRSAVLNTKQAWFSWQAAYAKARASRQAIISATMALRAANVGVSSGLKTELDVLQAQQQDATAHRDLHKALYDQIAAWVKLKAAIGWMPRAELLKISELFTQADKGKTP